jgi:predicted transposase/invertase (TIGR01784 family)
MSEVQRELAIEDAKEEGKIEVARKMPAKGVPVETIEEYTGLDEGDILALS